MRALLTVNVDRKMSDADLRRIFKDEMGIEPTDLPLMPSEPDCSDGYNTQLKAYFAERAQPILDRMPDDTEDHKAKKRRTLCSVKYCSVLPLTGTQFMATREIEGALTFRLINDKIEFLQEGCEDLICRLGITQPRWKVWLRKARFSLAGRIEIYEHGLEASTIRGSLVRNKLSFAFKRSSKDVVVATGAFVLFLVAVAITQSGVLNSQSKMGGHLDRFATAMITAVVVSVYSILHIVFTATPPVQWTAHYEKED
jgi:hypothetical protein